MLENFFSIFFLIALGYIFCYLYKEKDALENSLNDYLYYLSLPTTIFFKLITVRFRDVSLELFLFNSLPIICVIIIIYLLFKTRIIQHSFARTLLITSVLGNLVYLGFAFVQYFYGSDMVSYAAVSVSIQNLVIFGFAVYFLNLISDSSASLKFGLKKGFLNPIFISTVIGFLFNLAGIKLPTYFLKPIQQLSLTTIPLSLFLIGLSLYSMKVNISYLKKILIISFFKLFLLPFISCILLCIMGYSIVNFKISFILYTMPVAVASYPIAKEFELEKDVVSGSIFFTTLFYLFFWWIYLWLAERLF